jgi:hypothetical protein
MYTIDQVNAMCQDRQKEIILEEPIIRAIEDSGYIKTYCSESERGRIEAYKDGFLVLHIRTGYKHPHKTWGDAYSHFKNLSW